MKVISLNGSSKLRLKRTCVAIGIFDGVHRGHQYLIKQMLKTAKHLGAQPIVITFFPHPAHVLRPDLKLGYLNSLQDRLRHGQTLPRPIRPVIVCAQSSRHPGRDRVPAPGRHRTLKQNGGELFRLFNGLRFNSSVRLQGPPLERSFAILCALNKYM